VGRWPEGSASARDVHKGGHNIGAPIDDPDFKPPWLDDSQATHGRDAEPHQPTVRHADAVLAAANPCTGIGGGAFTLDHPASSPWRDE
jgi:hypothetical protein